VLSFSLHDIGFTYGSPYRTSNLISWHQRVFRLILLLALHFPTSVVGGKVGEPKEKLQEK